MSHDGDGKSVVKVLDLGLALLHDKVSAETELTSDGQVMGTYDFIAPEQAMESHTVDRRADIYSLGCTFYYLLTGRAPFQGRSEAKKLLAHQLEEPASPRVYREHIPDEVISALAKMLAKEPAERYGSMREVAETLAKGAPYATLESAHAPRTHLADAPTTATSIFPSTSQGGVGIQSAQRRRGPLVGFVGLAIGLLVVAAVTYGIIRIATPDGDFVVDTDDPLITFSVSKGTVTLNDSKTGRTYVLKVAREQKGEYVLDVSEIGADAAFKVKEFTIKRGDKQVALKAWFERKPPAVAQIPKDDLKKPSLLADKQAAALAASLQKLNPRFDGKLTYEDESGIGMTLVLNADGINNLAPVRSLSELRKLVCKGSGNGNSDLSDLTPLQGLNLTHLNITFTKVADLTPLKDMPLISLRLGGTRVTDFEVVKSLPLKEIVGELYPEKHAKLLHSIKTLERINGQPAAQFVIGKPAIKPSATTRSIFEQPVSLEITTKLGVKALVDVKDIGIAEPYRRVLGEMLFSRIDTVHLRKTGPQDNGLGRMCLDQGNGLFLLIPLRQVKNVEAEEKQVIVTLTDNSRHRGKLATAITGKDGKSYQLSDAKTIHVTTDPTEFPVDAKTTTALLTLPESPKQTFALSKLLFQSGSVGFGKKFKMTAQGETLHPDLDDFDKVALSGSGANWPIEVTAPNGTTTKGTLFTSVSGRTSWWLIGEYRNDWLVVVSHYQRSQGFVLEKVKR